MKPPAGPPQVVISSWGNGPGGNNGSGGHGRGGNNGDDGDQENDPIYQDPMFLFATLMSMKYGVFGKKKENTKILKSQKYVNKGGRPQVMTRY